MSEPPNKGKRLQHERQDHGWFASKPHSYADLIKHPLVEPWIKRYSEGDSQESYARALERILDTTGKDIEGLLALPPDEAKKVVFSVADALKKEGSDAMGKKIVITAKGFFEANKKPFELDKQEKRKYYVTMRKKVAYEVIPKKEQVYKMADASLSLKAGLRNRAMILCLFQSGVRENCLCRWTYEMFKHKLYPEITVPVELVITAEMDTKLQLYDLGYYVTFLQREAAEALKAYLNYRTQRGWHPKDKDPVFVTESTASRDRSLKPASIWEVIKQPQVGGAAGIDSHAIWVRLLRKTFQKVLNASDIDEDTKEALMGHKLPGSRGNYFDSHDRDEIAVKYMRCQFDKSAPPGQDTLTSGLAKLNASGWNVHALSDAEREAVVPFIMEKIKLKNLPRDLDKIRDQIVSRTQMAEISELMTIADMNRYIEAANPMRDQRSVQMEEEESKPKKTRRTAHNGGIPFFETRIISDENELLPLLDEGWDILKELAGGRIVVRRQNRFDE